MTLFKFKTRDKQITEIGIIPWERDSKELGVAIKFDDGTQVAQKVDYHENCFFVLDGANG